MLINSWAFWSSLGGGAYLQRTHVRQHPIHQTNFYFSKEKHEVYHRPFCLKLGRERERERERKRKREGRCFVILTKYEKG